MWGLGLKKKKKLGKLQELSLAGKVVNVLKRHNGRNLENLFLGL